MKTCCYFLVALLLAVTGLPVQAHPYHTSIAEVNYNAKTHSLEIALKVFTDDLEETLSNLAKKPVAMKQPEEVQKLLEAIGRAQFKFDLIDVFATPAEVLLALCARGKADARDVRPCIKVLNRYAWSYRFARPRALRNAGWQAWLSGDEQQAMKRWRDSLAQGVGLAGALVTAK